MQSRAPTSASLAALLLTGLLGASCTGDIGSDGRGSTPGNPSAPPPGPGNPGQPGPGPNDPGRPNTAECKTLDPGPSPMRLLTRVEYDNTVRDLLGDTRRLALTELPEDGRPVRGYANDSTGRSASDLLVDKFGKVAEKLATAAVAQLPMLLGGCDPGKDGEATCLGKFLDGFGKRVWRRPLTMLERQNLTGAFNEAKAKGFSDGLAAVIEVMLISPQFLYRYEQGTAVPGKTYVQLTPYEVASRLSYLLWGSMPDSELFAAAESGKLSTAAQIMVQARRMVADQRYMPMVTNFAEQFLELDQLPNLDKDTMTLPKWSDDLRPTMLQEADKFIELMFSRESDGKLSTFLTAPYSFLNGALGTYYGATGATGTNFTKVSLPADRTSGFLTQGGWLSVHATPDNGLTSLVFRGKFVREELLCQPIPDPPPNAQDENPPFTPMTTPREWSALRGAKPVCGACHEVIDPIGFGFENFDPIGKWRAVDRMKPVDASGTLRGTDVDGPFNGVVELGKKLASSKTVSDCVATQWFRFAAGRSETPRDACSLETLRSAFNKSGGDMRELLVAFTQTDAFLFRSKGDAP